MNFTLFTFDHSNIRLYFNGSDAYIPVSELIYIHEHPLVQPNFLTQLNELVQEAEEVIAKKKITGYPIDRFIELAIQIGTNLPELTHDNAVDVLKALRDLYRLSLTITGKPEY